MHWERLSLPALCSGPKRILRGSQLTGWPSIRLSPAQSLAGHHHYYCMDTTKMQNNSTVPNPAPAPAPPPQPIVAWVGLDWADRKHDLTVRFTDGSKSIH